MGGSLFSSSLIMASFYPTMCASSSSSSITVTPRLIIHGGAGDITRENLSPSSYAAHRASLLRVLHETNVFLQSGASALDAATLAVTLLEDDPLFNAGRGAVFSRAGTIELEASVMVSRGLRKRGVGVTMVKRVKNPIKFAREMLLRGEQDGQGGHNGGGSDPSGGSGGAQGHSMLAGQTVEDLARLWGLELCDEQYHWTQKRWDEHVRGLCKGGIPTTNECFGTNDEHWDGHEYLPQGTVGAVCLDRDGILCVATSTGGLTNKLPGRIGDTPTLGAGFWAEEWQLPRPGSRSRRPQSRHPSAAMSPFAALLPHGLWQTLGACVPGLVGFTGLTPATHRGDWLPIDRMENTSDTDDEAHTGDERAEKIATDQITPSFTRAVAMSGTGNGDAFLRLAAVRTAGAVVRFAHGRSLASAVRQIAGSDGELQQSAGSRWGRSGEGEGGIIGLELLDGRCSVVADFNCGGMFRAWVDDTGEKRMMVFKEKY